MFRNNFMPTERAKPGGYLPQHLAEDPGGNTNSTGSNDSFRTQVAESFYSQQPNYDNASHQTHPWSTPVVSSGGFEDFPRQHPGSRLKSLDPESPTYVPGHSSYNSAFQGPQPSYQLGGNSYNQGSIGNPQRQQLGQSSEYYSQSNMAGRGPVGGSQLPGTFNQYPAGPHQDYGNNLNFYGGGSSASSSSYAGNSLNQGYQNQVPYGPATGYAVAPTYNQHRYGNATYDRIQPSDRFRGQQAGSLRPRTGSFTGGRTAHFPGHAMKKRSVSDFRANATSSYVATAPVRFSSPTKQVQPTLHSQHIGGPVQQPPSAARASSPSKSTANSTRSSSVAPSTSRGSTADQPPTPGPQGHQLDRSFHSESRIERGRSETTAPTTPRTLRSSKGQSIMGISSASQVRADPTGSVERNVRGDETGFFTESTNRNAPPPKMLNLLAAGGIDASTLSPITEGPRNTQLTPRGGNPRAARAYIDPFGPTTSMMTPYNGSSLLKDSQCNILKKITSDNTRKPTVAELLDNIPFIEYCRFAFPDIHGVIKIKNIPYGVARAEVMAFLGRNARIINENEFEPVHIVMERVTSKTLDCYVEFTTFAEAVSAVNRFETNRTGGRGGRLGQRHVEVELSNQDELMKDLFPKAKNVQWRDGRPTIADRDPNDPYNSGFQGFVSKEELVMLVKHVDAPQRSPFSKECPQRPFECLISTLLKYPWYMINHITIEDRNLLFQATTELLKLLVERVNNEKDNVNLTPMLLKRVWRAALRCVGFTPAQKDDIVCIALLDDATAMTYNIAPFAGYWKILWTIGPKPDCAHDHILYYCAIIREATEIQREVLSLADRAARGVDPASEPKLFGDLDKYIQYNPDQPLLFQTIGAVAKDEWKAIQDVLHQVGTPAIQG